MASQVDDLVMLRARIKVRSGERVFQGGELFELSGEKAVQEVLEGAAELFDRQRHPPIAILGELERRRLEISEIGPQSLDAYPLAEFEKKALAGGIRRAIVEGCQLEWLQGLSRLKATARFALFDLRVEAVDYYLHQLQECWKTKREGSDTRTISSFFSAEDGVGGGLAPTRSSRAHMVADAIGGCRGKGQEYYVVGPDWAEFANRLEALTQSVEDDIKECLRTGRVLVVEEAAGGATLVAPYSWASRRWSTKQRKDLFFLMSRDLPRTWFRRGKSLKGKARQYEMDFLVRVLEANYAGAQLGGLKLVREHFIRSAVQERGVTETLAGDAWRIAGIPDWKTKGRLSDHGGRLTEIDFQIG